MIIIYFFLLEEQKRQQGPSKSYREKITSLDNKISEDIQEFIEQEKGSIEEEPLNLLGQSITNAVKASFKDQEKRQAKGLWFERAFGFFAGIVASLLASVIFNFLTRKKNAQ